MPVHANQTVPKPLVWTCVSLRDNRPMRSQAPPERLKPILTRKLHTKTEMCSIVAIQTATQSSNNENPAVVYKLWYVAAVHSGSTTTRAVATGTMYGKQGAILSLVKLLTECRGRGSQA
jgi:hypothetical protein